MNHRWKNRIFPPLVIVAVVGGVWYASTHRAEPVPTVDTTSTGPSTVASVKPLQHAEPKAETLATPLVEKLPGKVKFTVNATKVTKVQKVEFYVSNRLVGAVYSAPYSVSIDEVILQPGSHQVVAKVYTASDTKDTPPADFVSSIPVGTKPSPDAIAITPTTPAPSNNGSSSNQSLEASSTSTQPSAPKGPTASPATDLTAASGTTNDPAITLSWKAPTDGTAASYQIWRGGVLLKSNVTTTSYTDTTVEAAQTYYYQVISVAEDSTASDPSNTASATYVSPSASAKPNPGPPS